MHMQYCEITEREDGVYHFFEGFFYEYIVEPLFASPLEKTQLLYKRRKRKGTCISVIDSVAKLRAWDDSAIKVLFIMQLEG